METKKDNFEEVTETVEVTETEETTAEEVTVTENESEEKVDEASEEGAVEETTETVIEESVEEFTEETVETQEQSEKMIRTFEISHEDLRYALYNLLDAFCEADNEWYYITGVYDEYFVYESWEGGKIYGQKYTKDNDTVTLDGERYILHKEYLTDSEYAELQTMRSNYAALKEFKETVEYNELRAQKEEILNSEKYAVLAEKNEAGEYTNADFAELVKEMDNYSLSDLETKVKVMHSDFVSEHQAENMTFSVKPEKTKITSVKLFANPNNDKKSKPSRYGNLFKESK